jgi:16S rRNA (guanine527-N7)-methyltransferase
MMGSDVVRDVSRETAQRLDVLAALVAKWNPAINLVAPGSLQALRKRHIDDSLQLVALAPVPRLWVDLGSGAGFPGLVVAAALAEVAPAARVVLVDSDRRKAAFLRTAAQAMDVAVTVHAARAETLAPQGADVVSARALAPLPTLLPWVRRHLAPGGVALLPKGARHAEELAAARTALRFTCAVHPSGTAQDGVILAVSEIEDA